MSDVFLSYSRADLDVARRVASALESHGWSVWWDREIPLGKTFDRVIEEQIAAARCVVVLWSRNSVDSNWVKTEADEGLKRAALVPVTLDGTDPPFAYRRIQAGSLVGWSGEPDSMFEEVARAVEEVAGDRTKAGVSHTPRASMGGWGMQPSRKSSGRQSRWLILAGAAIAVGIGGFIAIQAAFDGCDDEECRAEVAALLDRAALALSGERYQAVGGGRWENEEQRLPDDESVKYTVTLDAGTQYALLGACDTGCREMRLSVVGTDGLDMAAGSTDSSITLEDLSPIQTGSFDLHVRMNDCRTQNCSFGLRLLARPDPPENDQ